jgi:hypothetical protein
MWSAGPPRNPTPVSITVPSLHLASCWTTRHPTPVSITVPSLHLVSLTTQGPYTCKYYSTLSSSGRLHGPPRNPTPVGITVPSLPLVSWTTIQYNIYIERLFTVTRVQGATSQKCFPKVVNSVVALIFCGKPFHRWGPYAEKALSTYDDIVRTGAELRPDAEDLVQREVPTSGSWRYLGDWELTTL